ncbi:hypothetical protein D9758_003280 [Tetrapyrgos nigripes]|uniref:Uncharacterized protein n=1 Tax=Tetrapyrgos nigripes TaxID=182062 RepID=A0A8H5GIG4_9AGAR|nr:hypothetical protein D9758_003280 [Tetrapyrgos nigripes]
MRQDASRISPDAAAVSDYVQHTNEVATFVRRNIVQGTRISSASDTESQEVWRMSMFIANLDTLLTTATELRLHEYTELGSNDSIKNPKSIKPGRDANPEPAALPEDATQTSPPRYYSALKRAHSQRQVPELKEEDIEETFVRGSGPV